MAADTRPDLASLFQGTAPLARGIGCPEPDQIWAGTSGELSFEELRALVDHSAHCGDCGEALRVACEVRSTIAPAGVTRLQRFHPKTPWLAGLALAAGLAGLWIWMPHLGRSTTDTVLERSSRGPLLQSALPDARQPRTALVLRWVPYPHAVRYEVTLTTLDLRVLFQQSGVTQSEVSIPPSVLAQVAPGTPLVWHVEASLEDGRSVESPAFTLELE